MFSNNELNGEEFFNWINLFFIYIYNFESRRTEFFEKKKLLTSMFNAVYVTRSMKNMNTALFHFLFF